MCNNETESQKYIYYIELYSGNTLYAYEDEAPEEFLKHIAEAEEDSWYEFTAYDPEDEETPLYNLATRISNIAYITWENDCGFRDPRCDCGQPLDCPEDEYVE